MTDAPTFYDLLELPVDASQPDVEAACRPHLNAAASGAHNPVHTAAETLSVSTTRRMYDFLLRVSRAEPPENTATFRDDGEADAYLAIAAAWGFCISKEYGVTYRVTRHAPPDSAAHTRQSDDPKAVMKFEMPEYRGSGQGDRPSTLDTTMPSTTKRREPASQAVDQPWPIEPVPCGNRIYYLSRRWGFIESAIAAPEVCQATCHIHGDRSVVFPGYELHPTAFRDYFRPGDDVAVMVARDPVEGEELGTYAMVTSLRSLASFEPPWIIRNRWQQFAGDRVSANASTCRYLGLKSGRRTKDARYRYHAALRAASIERAFAWRNPEGMRELMVCTNRYVAEMYPDLKRLAKPR